MFGLWRVGVCLMPARVYLETTSQRFAQTSHTLWLEGCMLPSVRSLSFITIVCKNAPTVEPTDRDVSICWVLSYFNSAWLKTHIPNTHRTARWVVIWPEMIINKIKHKSYQLIHHCGYKYGSNQQQWWTQCFIGKEIRKADKDWAGIYNYISLWVIVFCHVKGNPNRESLICFSKAHRQTL